MFHLSMWQINWKEVTRKNGLRDFCNSVDLTWGNTIWPKSSLSLKQRNLYSLILLLLPLSPTCLLPRELRKHLNIQMWSKKIQPDPIKDHYRPEQIAVSNNATAKAEDNHNTSELAILQRSRITRIRLPGLGNYHLW